MSEVDLRTLIAKTTSVKGCEAFFEGFPSARQLENELDGVVAILNDPEEGRKERVRALVVLSNLARVEEQRDVLLDAVRHLGETFENALIERETGAEQFSKQLKCDEMHELVLLLFIRIMNYRFSAADLLDLLRNKQNLALATIESTLKKSAYEDHVVCALTRLLYGMTMPSTYFSTTKNENGMMSEQDCSDFNLKINDLVDKFRSIDILKTWTAAVKSRSSLKRGGKSSPSSSDEIYYEIVTSGLEIIHNTYLFASKGATGFRQHCLVATKIPEDLLLPFMLRTIEASGGQPTVGPTAAGCVKMVLKTLVLLTFEMFSSTQTIQNSNFTVQFLTCDALGACARENPAILALLLLFNTNLDSLSPSKDPQKQENIDALAQALDATWRKCPTENKENVVRLFTTAGSLPVSRQTHTYTVLLDMLGYEGAGVDETSFTKTEAKEEETEDAQAEQPSEQNENNPDFRLLGDLPSLKTNNRWQVRKPKKKRKSKKKKKAVEQAGSYPVATPVILGIPDEFLCAMNGNVLKEPMRSKKSGLRFEKKSIEAWFERCGNVCPVTSKPLQPKDLVFDSALAQAITKFHIQQSCQMNAGTFEADNDDLYSF